MALAVIILGLSGAGIYTENAGFYWAAGAVGAWLVLVTLFTMFTASKIATVTKSAFDRDEFNRDRF